MPNKRKNLLGKKFGRLTVIAFDGTRSDNGHIRSYWKCRYACGEEIVRHNQILKARRGVASCGCYLVEHRIILHTSNITHGDTGKKLWRTWVGMRQRCSNKNVAAWPYYGGRGIKVCDSWLIYENFRADMGHPPSDRHSIDRIDGDGNYEPGNCRWATQDLQLANRKFRNYRRATDNSPRTPA